MVRAWGKLIRQKNPGEFDGEFECYPSRICRFWNQLKPIEKETKEMLTREWFKLNVGSLCLFALVQVAVANVATNGSLELLTGDTFRTVLPGTFYAGWNSVGNGDVEFDAAYFIPKAEGSGCVDLNGISYEGAISQTLTTEAGAL